MNCQAKVKSSQEKVKEKSPKKERLDFAYTVWSSLHPPNQPTHPTPPQTFKTLLEVPEDHEAHL